MAKNDNRNTQIDNPNDFEIGMTTPLEIPSAIENKTNLVLAIDSKLLSSYPILENQNILKPEPQSVPIIMSTLQN
jgi:hypothetical protein